MERDLRRFGEWLRAPLEGATTADCLKHLAVRAERSPHSAFAAWRALRSFYSFLATLDGCTSPMAPVGVPRLPEAATKGMSRHDHEAMLATCGTRSWVDLRDPALLEILACSGLRRGEVANLMLASIDLDERRVIVTRSKSGRPRMAFVTDEAAIATMKYLRRRPHAAEYL